MRNLPSTTIGLHSQTFMLELFSLSRDNPLVVTIFLKALQVKMACSYGDVCFVEELGHALPAGGPYIKLWPLDRLTHECP